MERRSFLQPERLRCSSRGSAPGGPTVAAQLIPFDPGGVG